MRKLSHSLHLWIGLIAGVFILAEGVTGAIAAWGAELLETLAPETRQIDPVYTIAHAEPPLPLGVLIAKLDQTYAPLRTQQLRFGGKSDEAWSAELRDADAHTVRVWFNPTNGTVLGEPRESTRYLWLQQWVRSAEKFHGDFPAAVALLLISASGLILWWRRPFFRIRRPFSFSSTSLELHAAIGFYASLLLFVFAGTGVIMSQQRLVVRVGNWLTHTPNPPSDRREIMAGSPRQPPLDVDTALALATHARPTSRYVALQWIGDRREAVAFRYRDTSSAGRTIVDLRSGQIRDFAESPGDTGPEQFVRWVRRVHEARAYGPAWRWIAGGSGMLLVVLSVTGPMIWWLRRRRGSSA